MAKQIGTITLNVKEEESILGPTTPPAAPALNVSWRYRDDDGLWVGSYIEENGALVECRHDVFQAQKKGEPVRVK